MKAELFFAWYDFWAGLYWDKKSKVLYVFFVPMLGIKISWQKCKGCNRPIFIWFNQDQPVYWCGRLRCSFKQKGVIE